jgi:C4-dicarboxylate-specific signal transduction histidine kinase
LAERTAELKKINEKLQQEIEQRKRAEKALKTYTTELEQSNRELWKKMMMEV